MESLPFGDTLTQALHRIAGGDASRIAELKDVCTQFKLRFRDYFRVFSTVIISITG